MNDSITLIPTGSAIPMSLDDLGALALSAGAQITALKSQAAIDEAALAAAQAAVAAAQIAIATLRASGPVPGAKGDPGVQGVAGVQGIAGVQGPPGLPGAPGSGQGGFAIPGVTSIGYTGGVLTFALPDNSHVAFTGTVSAPPAVLPGGIVPNSLSAITVAKGSIWPDIATALLGIKDSGTITIAPGLWQQSVHVDVGTFPSGLTFVGAGAYKTVLDGRGGIGAGHRLAWGKGVIHTNAPNCVFQNIGFINGGGADRKADGEAGIYSEQTSGTLTIDGCAFDGNEDGIFCQRLNFVVTINNCDFGLHVPNGSSLDGLSHDIYSLADTTIETNSRHYACVNGHGLKTRSKHVTTSGNFYAHGGGRCIDIPEGTATPWLSTNDVFTDLPGASTNVIGYADENSGNGVAGGVLTGTTLRLSRYNSTIWANAGTLNFSTPALTAYAQPGAPGPSLTLQGPGVITGLPALPAPSGGPLAAPVSPL